MAVTDTFLRDWVTAHGPWATHFCRTEKAARDILTDGLRPPAAGAGSYTGELAARPGHVYLCVGAGVRWVADQSFGRWPYPHDPNRERRLADLAGRAVAVDLRALNPAGFSPDEDCCYTGHIPDCAGRPPLPDPYAADPALTVLDPWADDERPDELDERIYRSYGEWAEAENVGSDPAHTQACWETFGSLAYRGEIPAAALRAVTVADLTAVPDRMPPVLAAAPAR